MIEAVNMTGTLTIKNAKVTKHNHATNQYFIESPVQTKGIWVSNTDTDIEFSQDTVNDAGDMDLFIKHIEHLANTLPSSVQYPAKGRRWWLSIRGLGYNDYMRALDALLARHEDGWIWESENGTRIGVSHRWTDNTAYRVAVIRPGDVVPTEGAHLVWTLTD